MEILRDPAWQFIGAIFAFFSIVGALWIYWLQKQTRELAFGLISSIRPVAIADELSSRVTVQLDGKPVQNLHLLVFGFKNSGKCAISPADFERKLSISFPDGQIVSADISSQSPSNLDAHLLSFESHTELSPLLLNSGDYLLIQVLLSATNPRWKVDARIRDVPKLAPINKIPPFFKSMVPLSMVINFLIGLCFLFFAEGPEQKKFGYFMMGFAVFIMPILAILLRANTPTRRSVFEN